MPHNALVAKYDVESRIDPLFGYKYIGSSNNALLRLLGIGFEANGMGQVVYGIPISTAVV
mgnify:CR=1 FL=1